jgi:hypothetical protein
VIEANLEDCLARDTHFAPPDVCTGKHLAVVLVIQLSLWVSIGDGLAGFLLVRGWTT